MSSRSDRANAIRALAMDAVEAANSGHPGAPMGLADIAEVLWREVLAHNPADPQWVNRDRFVLSNGHGSMLLYAALHLTGYPVSIADLKAFRQLHSPTAGHPEFSECPGVETTTGPLGQGFANAVGFALAERLLAQTFNRDGFPVVDHRTWVVAGDGCMMEGISHEAASLAGTLRLGKLVCIYDDNGISIDGEVAAWFTEDVAARFEAYGWRVVRDLDGHDGDAVHAVLSDALAHDDRPTLICAKTVIGKGAPTKAGTADAHGAALGAEEVAATRQSLNWGSAPFEIPRHIYDEWDGRPRGARLQQDWEALFDRYRGEYPDLAAELTRRLSGELPRDWAEPIRALARQAQSAMEPLETRKASQQCLGALAETLPELFGGSADLTGSNGTRWKGAPDSQYLSYGVREFAMTAITNGLVLHGGLRPFAGTFLVFMEYARNAVRLASLMKIPSIFVYTHDSVAVGEDGPTHQPVEQLTNLRTTPGLSVWRPCDTVESAVAWESAMARRDGPSALIFTRQKTEPQPRDEAVFAAVARGGYVLRAERGGQAPAALLIATGSEVGLAMAAAQALADEGTDVRVVSMPCTDVFLNQSEDYRDSVLPPQVRARVAVEAAHPDYWHKFVGLDGEVVGIDRFGLSAPGPAAMEALGMTVENVTAAVRRTVERHSGGG
ncbi:MAG: transketolase [Gammaproteobacteria bacterium]|nr:transketolase [Gammaproteobacteria bacterium]